MRLLIGGLVTGIAFGFLLQKGRVLRYDKQLAALRLQDMTIVKFMFSSVLVGMVGIHLLNDMGLIAMSLKATQVWANIVGGLIFGVGWGLVGYCPGTSLGAVGEGRIDALSGIAGMLFGAAVFAEVYPRLQNNLLVWADYGKITLPQLLGVNHWLVVAVMVVLGVLMFRWFEKKGL